MIAERLVRTSSSRGAMQAEFKWPTPETILTHLACYKLGAVADGAKLHKVLHGHLPGLETHHYFIAQKGDRLWTPADWAGMGGLINVMMPALNYGVPDGQIHPDEALGLIEQVRARISPHVAPREVEFIDALPMTATGKIMRRELKLK